MRISDTQEIPVVKSAKSSSGGPLVTVVMGTYNRRDLLPMAIRSVVEQNYQNWELIITNDGGEDVSDVAASFNDSRIRYFNMPANFGAANSYNNGLLQSHGKYITYIADDDIYYSNHLEILVQALEKYPEYGGVYSDQYRVDCDLVNGEYVNITRKEVDFSLAFHKVAMIAARNLFPHPCCMHRKELVHKAGLYDPDQKVLIDYDFFRRCSFYTDFLHVPAITGEYYFPQNTKNRLTDLQSKDSQKYNENLTRLKLKFPPKPWDRIKSLDILVYCKEFTEKTYQQLVEIFTKVWYPKKVFLYVDGYKKGFLDVFKGLGDLDLQLIFNDSQEGLDRSLEKFFNYWFGGEWFLLIDPSVVVDLPFIESTLQSCQDFIIDKYMQPTTGLVPGALYTHPQTIASHFAKTH